MSEEKKEKTRATPGPMTTWIGVWEDDTFVVKAKLVQPTAKQIREKLLELGEGDYDTITGRMGSLAYHKKAVDTFVV